MLAPEVPGGAAELDAAPFRYLLEAHAVLDAVEAIRERARRDAEIDAMR